VVLKFGISSYKPLTVWILEILRPWSLGPPVAVTSGDVMISSPQGPDCL